MMHQYDHRWATYDDTGDVRDVTTAEHADPTFVVMPRYWVDYGEVRSRLDGRSDRRWLMGFRDICRSTDERTMICGVFPAIAAGNNLPIAFSEFDLDGALGAVLSLIAFDFAARLKVGGTHMNFFLLEQLPVPPPGVFAEPCPWSLSVTIADWVAQSFLELTYTAWDMAPFARDLGDDGPPFVWDAERRAALRAELDGAFFHLYGINRDDDAHILSTFPIANRKDPALTPRVLDAYDRITTTVDRGMPDISRLDPPPGHGRRHQELP